MFIAATSDHLAIKALSILDEMGATTLQVPDVSGDSIKHDCVVLTSCGKPKRFPNKHLRIEGSTVFLREHKDKNRNVFSSAVRGMAVHFGELPHLKSQRAQKKREKRGPKSPFLPRGRQ